MGALESNAKYLCGRFVYATIATALRFGRMAGLYKQRTYIMSREVSTNGANGFRQNIWYARRCDGTCCGRYSRCWHRDLPALANFRCPQERTCDYPAREPCCLARDGDLGTEKGREFPMAGLASCLPMGANCYDALRASSLAVILLFEFFLQACFPTDAHTPC